MPSQLMMANKKNRKIQLKRSRSAGSDSQPSTPRRQHPHRNLLPQGLLTAYCLAQLLKPVSAQDYENNFRNETVPENQSMETLLPLSQYWREMKRNKWR